MNILLLSPGYPGEMPNFTRGLSEVGANVFGVGDQHPGALPDDVRRRLSGYLQVRSLWDEAAVVKAVQQWPDARKLDSVECLWEPGMVLAARVAVHLAGRVEMPLGAGAVGGAAIADLMDVEAVRTRRQAIDPGFDAHLVAGGGERDGARHAAARARLQARLGERL